MKILTFTAVITSIIFAMISCSNISNPIDMNNSDIGRLSNIPISDSESIMHSSSYPGILGAWKVHIDTQALTFDIIPARNAQKIGDIFDADLSQFLTVAPCNTCMRITSMELDGYFIILTVGIRHPFMNTTTRPDLHGFDVRAIFIHENFVGEFPDIKVVQPDGTQENANMVSYYGLVNADGYTSHFDDLVTDPRYFLNGSDVNGNLNPFLRFFDNPATGPFDPHAPTGHNVMPVGSDFQTKQAIFIQQQGGGAFDFYIIADVAYGQSAVLANRQNPQYYLPAFNRTEPWRMEYWIENNNLDSSDTASTADVVVQVFDWQHGASVDPNYPDPANPSGIPESSNVVGVMLSIPFIQAEPVVVTTPEAGDGSPQNPLRYRLQVTNINGTSGVADGLLAIRDEQWGQASPHGRIPIPVSPSGFPYDTQDILDYTLYDWVHVNIPFTATGQAEYLNELKINEDDLFTTYVEESFRPTFFMDMSGKIFTYQWDYDYDGITFDVDGVGCPSPRIPFTTGGLHRIGLRILTNSVPPREYVYTLPVYKTGEVFHYKTNTTPSCVDLSSNRRGDAVAMSSNRYYVVYTSEFSGQRDVWLGITDGNGVFSNLNITILSGLVGSFYYPAIEVIEDGVHDGIYIVFNSYNGGNWDLYSVYGNLDGSGFSTSNVRPLATSSDLELHASIVHQYGELFVYYWRLIPPDVADIWIAHSADFGQSWNTYGEVDTDPSLQVNPTVVYSSFMYRTLVFWEDYRNYLTSGADLYMAMSYGGLDFEPSKNLSSFQGRINELYPEATTYKGIATVAYLANVDGTDETHVWLKMLDPFRDSNFNYDVVDYNQSGYTSISPPSVATSVNGFVTLAYGARDIFTSDVHAIILDIQMQNGMSNIQETRLYNQVIGNVSTSVFNDFYPGPGVVNRDLIDGEGVESFIAWTTFEDGITDSPNPIQQYFGKVDAMCVITDGKID